MPDLKLKTGQTVHVPAELVQKALATGLYEPLAPDAIVPVVTGEGTTGGVAAADLERLQGISGVRPETGAEGVARSEANREERLYGGVGGGVAALGAGAARGLTLGLSDVALANLGVDPDELAALRRVQHKLSMAGEIGGAAAPAFLSGGTGALGAIARATPAGMVSRGGRAIAGLAEEGGLVARAAAGAGAGAAEGGSFGAGQAVSDALVNDKPLTADAFLASVRSGALYGAAFGAGIAAAIPAGRAVKEGVSKVTDVAKDILSAGDAGIPAGEAAGVSRVAGGIARLDRLLSWAKGSSSKDMIASAKEALRVAEEARVSPQVPTAQRMLLSKEMDAVEAAAQKIEGVEAGKAPATQVTEPPFDPTLTPRDLEDLARQYGATPGEMESMRTFARQPEQFNNMLAAQSEAAAAGVSARPNPLIAGIVDDIDSALSKVDVGIGEDVAFWHGAPRLRVDGREVAAGDLNAIGALRPGAVVDMGPGFTLVSETIDRVGDQNLAVRILYPGSGKAIPVGGEALDWILPRNTSFQIRQVYGKPGSEIIEVVPHDPSAALAAASADDIAAFHASVQKLADRLGTMGRKIDVPANPVTEVEAAASKADIRDVLPETTPAERTALEAELDDVVERVDTTTAPILEEGKALVAAQEPLKLAGGESMAEVMAAAEGPAGIARKVARAEAAQKAFREEFGAEAGVSRKDILRKVLHAPPAAFTAAMRKLQAYDDAMRDLAVAMDSVAPVAVGAATRAAQMDDLQIPRKAGTPAPMTRGWDAGDVLAMADLVGLDIEDLPIIGRIPGIAAILQARLAYRRLGGGLKIRMAGAAGKVGAVAARAQGVRRAVGNAVTGLLESAGKAIRRGAVPATSQILHGVSYGPEPIPANETVEESFRRVAEQLTRAAGDSGSLRSKLREGLDMDVPELVDPIVDAAARKIQYLASSLPKDPREPAILQEPWHPDSLELYEFGQRLWASESPLAVLRAMSGGDVSPAAAEAFREVYPALYADMRRQLVEQISSRKRPLSLGAAARLSTLLDLPVTSFETPSFAAAMQEGYQKTAPGPEPTGNVRMQGLDQMQGAVPTPAEQTGFPR